MVSEVFTTSTGFMCTTRRCGLAILGATIVLVSMVPARAQIARSWNTGNGSWFVGTNWSPIGVPGPLDGAFIGNLPGIEADRVTLTAGDSVAAVSIQSGMMLSVLGGTLTVNGNTTVSGNAQDEFGLTRASTLELAGLAGAIAYVTSDLTLTDGAEAQIFDGVVLRVLGTFAIDESSELRSGNGAMTRSFNLRDPTPGNVPLPPGSQKIAALLSWQASHSVQLRAIPVACYDGATRSAADRTLEALLLHRLH